MAGRKDVISAAQAALFLIPPGGGSAIPLGIVEDFSAENRYESEQLRSLGNFLSVDGVVNGADGSFRYGKVLDLDPEKQGILAPDPAIFTEWESFDILCLDPGDKKPICRLSKCLPTSEGISMSNGRALRDNFSGVCRFVQIGEQASRSLG